MGCSSSSLTRTRKLQTSSPTSSTSTSTSSTSLSSVKVITGNGSKRVGILPEFSATEFPVIPFQKIFEHSWKIAYIQSVYDGDTCTACFYFNKSWYSFRIRMLGYDSAEMKPLKSDPNRDQEIKEAIRARDKLIELVDKKWIVLETCGFEKYGRVLGNVYNIPQSLIYQNTNFEDYTPTNTLIDMCNIYNNKSLEYHVNFYMVEKKFGVPFMVKK